MEKKGRLEDMTLVIAAPGSDFMVLGADSRGTIVEQGGTRVEINIMRKLVPISDHVAILLYGAANEARFLVERFQSSLRRNVNGVTEISDRFASFCRAEARELRDVPFRYAPDFGFVIAGLDRRGRNHIPKAYSLSNGGGYRLGLYEPYALEGKPIIGDYLFTSYYENDLTLNQLSKLVAITISETRKIDGDVGGPIRMAVIASEGFREISDQDISAYIREWERNRVIKNTSVDEET